jgi:phosphoribosylaminoimidazole-succinocarboxamide synthase
LVQFAISFKPCQPDHKLIWPVKDILPDGDIAELLKSYALALYNTAAAHSISVGLILADTKFEFGLLHSSTDPTAPPTLILVDECLTPDSSRFWPSSNWAEGNKMVGFDKQFLREWLKSGGGGFGANGGGVEEEGVEIPDDVIKATFGKYEEAYHLLTGKKFIP